MAREIFGTDGIRGKAYVYPLDEIGAKQVGKAVATHFANPGEMICIGRDPRQSSLMLETALAAGIVSQGVNVSLLGMVPTAALAYVTRTSDAKAGVMITASHNPYRDNGIKVFSSEGTKLPDTVESRLNALITSELPDRAKAIIKKDDEGINEYCSFLCATSAKPTLAGFKLAIDCANGATSMVAAQVFRQLGVEVIVLFDKPNGTNINEQCGATDTKALQRLVLEKQLDGGVAFDGDGDRAIFVDAMGRVLTGDHVMYLLAICRKEPGVVATIMSNMGFEQALQAAKVNLVRTAVGDRYVIDGLRDTGYKLGGEQSGHVIMTDFSETGDGILTALQVLNWVQQSGKSLAEWHDAITIWPQTLLNVETSQKAIVETPTFKEFVKKQQLALGGSVRLNIRASGTESLIRIMVEAPDSEVIARRVARSVEDLIEQAGKE